MANTLELHRNGAVGFIVWLDDSVTTSIYFLAAGGESGTAFCKAASSHLPSRLI